MNLVFHMTLNVRNKNFNIKFLVIVSTVTIILSLTYVTHEARSTSSSNNSSSLTEAVQLGVSILCAAL